MRTLLAVREGSTELGPGPSRGPLTGVPVSYVDFKKCQCHMSLSLIYVHIKFESRAGCILNFEHCYSMAGWGLVGTPVENALAGVIRRPRPVATSPWQRAWTQCHTGDARRYSDVRRHGD